MDYLGLYMDIPLFSKEMIYFCTYFGIYKIPALGCPHMECTFEQTDSEQQQALTLDRLKQGYTFDGPHMRFCVVRRCANGLTFDLRTPGTAERHLGILGPGQTSRADARHPWGKLPTWQWYRKRQILKARMGK